MGRAILVVAVVHRLLTVAASPAVEHRLQSTRSVVMGLVALRHVGYSQTRDRSCVPRIGKQFLNLCTTREALLFLFLENIFIYLFGCAES